MIATLVAGRYHIEAQIGIGGMGVVYRARDERLKRDVALKVIAPHLMQQESARLRFLREAQALAGLTHPNIVTIYDMAEDADTHLVFLVMELLSGHSLRQYMAEEVCPRGSECPSFSRVALPLCRALEAAHKRGVLHRDIKPENIFICEDGTLKLMDFGLARLLGDVSKNQSSTVAGTLAYMAPEQLRGEPLDARADLYALGVVFYEFLAERLPFVADNPGAVLLKHLTEPPPHLRDALPSLPDAMDAIVTRMLAKEPDARFASAQDVRSALEQPAGAGTLVLDVDAVMARLAGQERHSALVPDAGRATAPVLPTTAVNSTSAPPVIPSISQATVIAAAPAAQPLLSAPAGASNGAATVKRAARHAPVYAGLTVLGVAALVLAGKAWPRNEAQKPFPPAPPISHQAANAQTITPLEGGKSVASAGNRPAASAPATLVSKANPSANTPANAPDKAAANDKSAQDHQAGSGSGSQNASPNGTLTPLSNSERAELETLRKEQQEELALLRSLKNQIGAKPNMTAETGHVSAPARPLDSPTVSVPAAPRSPQTAGAAAPSSPSTLRTRKTEASALPSAAPTSHTLAQAPAAKPVLGSETSEFEEARPQQPLQLRVWRRAAEDKHAIHINLRTNADCNAYFYVVEIEKQRAVRAYPGPERFLAPQTSAPQELRLPLPDGVTDNRKAVLVIAAPQEIANLPAVIGLPPAPLDMPQPNATPQRTRQALHRYNDQIGMQLQQSHVRVGGQTLHPHDVIVRMVGLRPPPAGRGSRNGFSPPP